MAAERVLIIDDEPGVRTALENILRDEGFVVASAESGEQGLERFGEGRWDAVMLDVWLPGIDGLETLVQLKRQQPQVEVVMISGHGTIDTAVRATKLGAFDFVEKPLSLERTLLVLRNALRQRRLAMRNRQLMEHLARRSEIVGRSAAAELLRHESLQAASSSAPVLLRGERGSGRQTLARRIHAAGETPDGPFFDVNCAMDGGPAPLLGSAEAPGSWERAEGGTLFLRDVEALEPSLQARLAARVLAERGAVRVLASTDPRGEGLTPELGRALGVIVIDVPPLRQRREDIPELAERFMAVLAREYGRPPKRWQPDALRALRAHDWPGNLRELHDLTERLVLFTPGESIRLRDLPQELGGARLPAEDLYREFASLADGLRAFERYYIGRVLSETGSDRAAAARKLGLSLDALERRIEAG